MPRPLDPSGESNPAKDGDWPKTRPGERKAPVSGLVLSFLVFQCVLGLGD